TIASTLGLNETSRSLATESLVLHLRDRRALLVLDNFEQVLSAAPMLGCLLVDAPGTQILFTSRALFNVPEERIYPVPPLQLADASQPLELARLRETEAIRLFVDRAREAREDFELSAENVEAVVELCRRLDGLPLALELAAARIKLLSPRSIVERLGGRREGVDGWGGGAWRAASCGRRWRAQVSPRGTGRFAPRSTGATTSSRPTSSRSSQALACSSAASRSTVPRPRAAARDGACGTG